MIDLLNRTRQPEEERKRTQCTTRSYITGSMKKIKLVQHLAAVTEITLPGFIARHKRARQKRQKISSFNAPFGLPPRLEKLCFFLHIPVARPSISPSSRCVSPRLNVTGGVKFRGRRGRRFCFD